MASTSDEPYSWKSVHQKSAETYEQSPKNTHYLLSVLFLAGAVGALVVASDFRFIETQAAAITFEILGLGETEYLGGDKLYARGLGTPVRFTVTQQCGVMLLIAPLLLAAAVVVRSAHVTSIRVLLAVFGSFVTLLVANQLRLALIGWTIKLLGFDQGFPLGHLVLGTILSIFAVLGSIVFFARAVGASTLKRPKRETI